MLPLVYMIALSNDLILSYKKAPHARGCFLVVFEADILALDVGFALEEFVVTKFERSGVDWEGFIEGNKGLIAAWNGGNSAKNERFLAIFGNAGTGMVWEEAFTRGEEAAVVAPEVANNWRNNAVMHMTGDVEIELAEVVLDLWVV